MKPIQEKTKKIFVKWIALAVALVMLAMIVVPAIFSSAVIG